MEKYEREERTLIFTNSFKRTERITLLIVFLLTVPVLVFAFINNGAPENFGIDDFGGRWVREHVIEQIIPAGFLMDVNDFDYTGFHAGIPFWSSLCAALMVFLPMSLRNGTRKTGAYGMMVSSYIFAFFLWIYSLAIVWCVWGRGTVFGGVFLGYVGIIPFGFIGALSELFSAGHWEALVTMLALIACFAGARITMRYARRKCEESVYRSDVVPEPLETGERFRRAERVTLLIAFAVTVPILVFTFICNNNLGGILTKPHYVYVDFFNMPHGYWIWNSVIEKILPVGVVTNMGNTPVFQPGIELLLLPALGAAVLAFLPMSFIRKTRYAGTAGMMIASYVFAVLLWIYSLGIVFYSWGAEGAAAGACLGYIGIIPEAIVAALGQGVIGGRWFFIIPALFLAACFIFTRLIANNAKKRLEGNLPEEEKTAAGVLLEGSGNEE